MFKLIDILRQWRPGALARGTVSVTFGLGLRSVAQGAVFVFISRTLGIEKYGAFAAIFALASVIGSFGALGTQTVMLREVARSSSAFASAWGKALVTVAISTPVLLLIYLLLACWILPNQLSIAVVVLVGIAEVILAPVSQCAIAAYQGHERMGRAARMALLPILPRLFAAVMLWLLAKITPSGMLLLMWAVLYAASALVTAFYTQRLVHRDLGRGRRPGWTSIWRTIRQGIPFAAGDAAVKTYTDIDKTMLARLATLESTGAYSAGHRVVDLATIPIVSLISVTWPRFFQAGSDDSQGMFRLARGILPIPIVYAALAGLGLYYAASFLPVLLGEDYAAATTVLQWLAWLPLVSLPRLLLQIMMVSSDRQHAAVATLAIGAASNVGLNLWLIPVYGWQGAVMATYAAEILMTLAMLFHFKGTRLAGSADA